MHPDLLTTYRAKILPNIEEPIREIVNALWELPFVVDTNEACCGHIVTNDWARSLGGYEDIRQGLYWYPHGIRLGVFFSLEEELKETAELFRDDISKIPIDIGLKSRPFERKYRTIGGQITEVLHMWYHSEFPDTNSGFQPPRVNVDRFITSSQDRLVDFWEAFADVVRKYNSQAKISPIGNKNFLQIIDWADLGDPKRYLFR